jgi:hypothetical protein
VCQRARALANPARDRYRQFVASVEVYTVGKIDSVPTHGRTQVDTTQVSRWPLKTFKFCSDTLGDAPGQGDSVTCPISRTSSNSGRNKRIFCSCPTSSSCVHDPCSPVRRAHTVIQPPPLPQCECMGASCCRLRPRVWAFHPHPRFKRERMGVSLSLFSLLIPSPLGP